MDKVLIDLLSRSYLNSKRILRENELGLRNSAERYLEPYRLNVYHIEQVVNALNDNDRFIIDNEVIKGKRGNWYYEYMSTSTYYKHRKKAYSNFLSSLN